MCPDLNAWHLDAVVTLTYPLLVLALTVRRKSTKPPFIEEAWIIYSDFWMPFSEKSLLQFVPIYHSEKNNVRPKQPLSLSQTNVLSKLPHLVYQAILLYMTFTTVMVGFPQHCEPWLKRKKPDRVLLLLFWNCYSVILIQLKKCCFF